MQFKAKEIIPGIIAILLLCGTYYFLSHPREIFGDPNGVIPLVMPENIDGYEARILKFCTNDQCARAFDEDELCAFAEGKGSCVVSEELHVNASEEKSCESGEDFCCPICGSEMSAVSIGEAKLLPKNTPIFRRLYKHREYPDVSATFVFSGMERRSIHRPQVCLVAQGNKITNEYTYNVKISEQKTLPVKVLEIAQVHSMPDGTKTQTFSIYAYWFFNPERETEEHLKRFLYMSMDNAFRNYRPRWAYVSITFVRSSENPDLWKEVLNDFVPKLYPTIDALRQEMKKNGNKSVKVLRSSDANTYDETDDSYDASVNKK